MTKGVERWVHLSSERGEKLLRFRGLESCGEMVIPGEGRIRFEELESGEAVFLWKGRQWSSFEEREVLSRSLWGKNLCRSSEKRFRLAKFLGVTFFSLGLLWQARHFLPEGGSPEVIALEVPSEEPIEDGLNEGPEESRPEPKKVSKIEPLPQAPKTENKEKLTLEKKEEISKKAPQKTEVQPEVIPKPKPKKRKANLKWKRVEKEMRRAFSRGDLDHVEELFKAYRKQNQGRMPKALSFIFSEVQYARCKKNMDLQEYPQARERCEKAFSISKHSRASALLGKLGEMARQKYLEGYAMEKSNPGLALSRYREALGLAPEGNIIKLKSSRKIKQFQ